MALLVTWFAAVAACAFDASVPGDATSEAVTRACVRAHAERAERSYAGALDASLAMRAAVRELCRAPSDAALARARETWVAARDAYGRTEAYRFGNGPIDARRGGRETWINAWPVDEACIEPSDRSLERGIIGDPGTYPVLGRTIIRLHNQRGGETNVCTGWHAIEFMLWGEDRSEDGPGRRPASDFQDASGPRAARRREYLLEITEMLCDDLEAVASQWRTGSGEYRARFESDPLSVRWMMAGPALLCGFEMAGERLAVPYETRDQEEEHSCFSDTTDRDFRANMRGIESVLMGNGADGAIAAVRTRDAAAASAMERALARATKAVDAIPAPFDRAIRAADGSPERARLKEAMEALEALSESIGAGGRALGFALPTEPQG